MTEPDADKLIAKCCCWFDISTAPWHKTARAELKKVLLELDYAEAERALREQSIWGQQNPSALKMHAVFSMLNEKAQWARSRKREKE